LACAFAPVTQQVTAKSSNSHANQKSSSLPASLQNSLSTTEVERYKSLHPENNKKRDLQAFQTTRS